MRNHCYENDFDLHENKTAWRTHFHMKGFALKLVLKQRHKRTRKWPILLNFAVSFHSRRSDARDKFDSRFDSGVIFSTNRNSLLRIVTNKIASFCIDHR